MRKKLIALVGLVAAGAISAAALAPSANAVGSVVGDQDDYSGYNYNIELDLVAVPGSPYQAASLAQTVCEQRSEGVSEAELVDRLMPYFNSEQSVQIVMGAEWHFCSVYEHDGSIGSAPPPQLDYAV